MHVPTCKWLHRWPFCTYLAIDCLPRTMDGTQAVGDGNFAARCGKGLERVRTLVIRGA